VTAPGTCFHVYASGVTLDCGLRSIGHGTAATGTGAWWEIHDDVGVWVHGGAQVTIQNCAIGDADSRGKGIVLDGTKQSGVLHNNIATKGPGDGNVGILLTPGADDVLVDDNHVYRDGKGAANIGIAICGASVVLQRTSFPRTVSITTSGL
jgi:hypothetical protein